MKIKLAIVGAAIFSMATVTTAMAKNYGMAGCGLGSVLIEENGFMQVFAATTNGTFANQTFGITSGTSNCTADGLIVASKTQEAFFEANFANIQKDAASGQGEYLTAFADLMSCSESARPTINKIAQESYEKVFPTAKTTSAQALYLLKIQLSQNTQVANSCQLL